MEIKTTATQPTHNDQAGMLFQVIQYPLSIDLCYSVVHQLFASKTGSLFFTVRRQIPACFTVYLHIEILRRFELHFHPIKIKERFI